MDIRMCSVITLHFKHLANIPVIALAGTRRTVRTGVIRKMICSVDGEIHQVPAKTVFLVFVNSQRGPDFVKMFRSSES